MGAGATTPVPAALTTEGTGAGLADVLRGMATPELIYLIVATVVLIAILGTMLPEA